MDKNIENVDCVKSFNNELASLYECKPPISKAKMVQITKSAMKAIKYYKHVVMSVEKFIQKCRPEYKLPGLYVIDSIVRQSRHQYGVDKDVFAPRFSKNISVTFQSLFKCPEEDKLRIVRVIRLWLKNGVFSEDDLRPLLDLAAGLGLDITDGNGERNGKGDSTMRKGRTPSPLMDSPPAEQTHTGDSSRRNQYEERSSAANMDPVVLSQLQKLSSTSQQRVEPERNLTQKLLADYEYSDEESGGEEDGGIPRGVPEPARHDLSANLKEAAHNLLRNPELLQQIHQMQRSMRGPETQLPTNANAGHHNFQHPPPPAVLNIQQPPPQPVAHPHSLQQGSYQSVTMSPPPQPPFVRGYENQGINYPPPAEPVPSERVPSPFGRAQWPTNLASERLLDRDDRRRAPESSRRRSRSRSRERRRRGSRSRSRSRSGSRGARRRNRSRSSDRREREHERERKKQGLPPIKPKHVSICSRTLWFGRIPSLCEAHEIRDGLKDYGEPVSIDLITPRGCAYVVMPDRKSAFKVLDRLRESLKVQNRLLKMAWAPGKGVKEYKDGWIVDHGVTYLPWDCLPNDLTALLDGGSLDVQSLPDELKGSYTETGKLEAPATTQIVMPNLSVAPPPFPNFGNVPPGVFAAGVLPPSFAPPLLSVSIQNPALGAPIRAGALSNITAVPPPMPVAPPSIAALGAAAGLRAPGAGTSHVIGDASGGQIPSLISTIPPLYGHSAGQPSFSQPPPSYARPIGIAESPGFGRAGFYQPNRGGDGGFDGHQHFRGRGRGMHGGGDFGRGRFNRGGGMPRRDWAPPQAGRFDSAMRNMRSRWSAGGDEHHPTDFDNDDQQRLPHRSRWGPESENSAGGHTDVPFHHSASIPVIGSSGRHETEHESNEPPPPGE